MAKFSKVKASSAPSPERQTGRLNARMRQYEDYINSVKTDEAGKLVPEGDESARAISLRVSRAAKRLGKKADTWVRDGAVYFIVS